MTSQDFCYWLQGFFEINGGEVKEITPEQSKVIQNELASVFEKVTPKGVTGGMMTILCSESLTAKPTSITC